jgi:tRNA acetyltransferase TAN1
MSEVRYFIGDLIGDEELSISFTNVSGLLTCKTSLDPFETIHQLTEFAEDNPHQFRFAIKFTPIEMCVRSEIESIVEAVTELRSKIEVDETFRVTVRRRHTELDHMEIVSAAADLISREVDLEEPDKHLWIEVIGDVTGVSVLIEEKDILSIMTMRDDMY